MFGAVNRIHRQQCALGCIRAAHPPDPPLSQRPQTGATQWLALQGAEELHDALMAPLVPILEGKTRLVLGPNGPLYELTLPALVECSASQLLIEEYDLAVAPSATVCARSAVPSPATPPEPPTPEGGPLPPPSRSSSGKLHRSRRHVGRKPPTRGYRWAAK